MVNDLRRQTGRQSKWGICTNPNCPNYRQKIEIERGDLICPEESCKKPLSPCAPPPKKKKFGQKYGKKVAIIVAAVTVLGGVGFGLTKFFIGSDDSLKQIEDSMIVASTDSVVQEQPVAEDLKQEQPAEEPVVTDPQTTDSTKKTGESKTQGKDFGYAIYKGETQNGQPHGTGTLTFKEAHIIDSRDSKERMAEAGDYVSGLFYKGHVETAKWYGADGSLKGSILLGRP